MAKKQPEHGLRLTQGNFQIRGIVTGVQSNNFYVEKAIPNSTNKVRNANFGVKYDVARDGDNIDLTMGKTIYPTVQGFTRDSVYFSKRTEDKKTETKQIPWAQRLEFANQNPDWRIIGVNVGLEKDEEDKNIKQYLTEFDAAKAIKDKLKDDMSVFVRGNLEFRSYTDKNGDTKRFTSFAANQVSLCADINYADEKFEAKNDFEQEIVYTGIEKETEGDKPTGRFIVNGYVVSFNAIEPVSFIMVDSKLANLFRKNLKPYNSIKVHGKIEVSHVVEEVVEDSENEWGDSNPMSNRRTNAPTKRELVITGASPSTISTEDYTEESIAAGIQKLKAKENVNKNFGEKKEATTTNDDDWGTPADDNTDEEPW